MLALIGIDEQGSETILSDHRAGAFVQVQVDGKNHDCQSAYDGWMAGPYRLAKYADEDPVPEGKRVVSTVRTLVDGVPTVVNTTMDVDLDILTTSLCAQIDDDAETARKKYITTGDGQAMTYQRKVDQARAYLAATDPADADYPALMNEVGITGADCTEVATVIMTMFAAWEQIGDQVENLRLSTKKAIRDAATFADKQAAYAAVVWP